MVHRRVVSSTIATDFGRSGVGGPEPGNLANVGIVIDPTATPDRKHRVLARLASVFVPQRQRGWVRGIKQLLTIAAQAPTAPTGQVAPLQSPPLLIERQVVTPIWSFPDGNVIWYLRRIQASQMPNAKVRAVTQVNYSQQKIQEDAAILFRTLPAEPGGYVPPGGGIVPGTPMEGYGVWYDMRFPWYAQPTGPLLAIPAVGPCFIQIFASIWQTDPTTRPNPADGVGLESLISDAGLHPEDRFWMSFPDTCVYYRIGAELCVEFEALCPEPSDPPSFCCGEQTCPESH